MGAQKGGTSGDRKGKKPHKNKPTSVKHGHYKVSGDKVSSKDKTCPRCGPATFLAQHKDRLHCGKCNYTEFARK